MPGAPPGWATPTNITPHEEGIAGWTYEQFLVALREGRRPDGSELQPPMTTIQPYVQRMDDEELAALWAYLQQVTPVPTNR